MEPQQSTSGAKKYIVLLVILALIILGVSLLGKNKQTPVSNEPTTTETSESAKNPAEVNTNTKSVTEIDYTDQGFTPSLTTIKLGDTVKFVNKSSGEMWVASAMHPTHTAYSGTTLAQHCPDTAGTAFDQCATGNEFSFTFNKAGTWGYHNHVNAKMFGKITVTAN